MITWPIAPLTPADLDFAVVDYGFQSLTANELAQLPSLESFIDSIMPDLFASLADQTTLIASMAGDLDDLDNILNEVENNDLTQIIADLAGVAAIGDSLLGDATTQVG